MIWNGQRGVLLYIGWFHNPAFERRRGLTNRQDDGGVVVMMVLMVVVVGMIRSIAKSEGRDVRTCVLLLSGDMTRCCNLRTGYRSI